MSMFDALEISASAMRAERVRAEVVTANLANAETTRTDQGGPYQRKQVVFGASRFHQQLAGASGAPRNAVVQVLGVVPDPAPPNMRYEPGHPDANAKGLVAYPSINPVEEMVDLMDAVRAYQMNASAVNATKQMIQQSLDILR
jgi:flagellar basal-body rod protein FlgC